MRQLEEDVREDGERIGGKGFEGKGRNAKNDTEDEKKVGEVDEWVPPLD